MKKTPITNEQAKVLLPLQGFINNGEDVFNILVEDGQAALVIYNFDTFQNAMRLISITSSVLTRKFQYNVPRKTLDVTGNELAL